MNCSLIRISTLFAIALTLAACGGGSSNSGSGNSGTDSSPQITLLGKNGMTIVVGGSFTDPGAAATDAEDGDLAASIITTSDLDTATVGNYTITYSVTDSANNTSAVVRNVYVVDAGSSTIPLVSGCALDRAGALAAAASSNPYSYNGTINMGPNLTPVVYWEAAFPFVDLRRQSDRSTRDLGSWWVKYTTIADSGATLDANGNVVSLSAGEVDKILISSADCVYGGDYVVLWDPTKSPSVRLTTSGGVGTLTLKTDDAVNGRRVYTWDIPTDLLPTDYQSAGLWVAIDAPITGDVDYHVLLPGTETDYLAGNLFNPHFLEDLQGSKVLRFMNWLGTNESTVVDVADLPNTNTHTWAASAVGGGGVPYGVTMQLTKAVNVPVAWINVPIQATDATITEIARQVYAQWQPGITVYVELSNEVWNTIFSDTTYATDQGAILFPTLTGRHAMSTWLAQRSIEMKNIFKTEFGVDAAAVKLVIAGQLFSSSYVHPTDPDLCYLNCRLSNQYNDIANEIDVYAVAPYVPGKLQGATYADANDVANWTDAQFFTHLNADPDSTNQGDVESVVLQILEKKNLIATLTGRTDIEYTAYEFGQHLTAGHAPDSDLDIRYKAFQSTPEMGTLYYNLIQGMIDGGMTLSASFNLHGRHNRGGYWGDKQGIAGSIVPRKQAVDAAK
jgi:hypothetical protein